MGSRVLAALIFVAVASCGPAPLVVPPPVPTSGDTCDQAEARLRQLDCRQSSGQPWYTTPEGTPFGTACRDALADGRDWHPECIRSIQACSEIQQAYAGTLCR